MNYLIALPNQAKLNNMPITKAIFDKDRSVRYEVSRAGCRAKMPGVGRWMCLSYGMAPCWF